MADRQADVEMMGEEAAVVDDRPRGGDAEQLGDAPELAGGAEAQFVELNNEEQQQEEDIEPLPDVISEEEDDDELEEDDGDRRRIRMRFPGDVDAMNDTTAEQARRGRDIQGIPWPTTPWTRAAYREQRDKDYKSYFNVEDEVLASAAKFAKNATKVKLLPSSDRQWEFYRNWRRIQPSIVHFQLRHLIAAASAHDIFYCAQNRVMHYNLLKQGNIDEVFNFTGDRTSTSIPNLPPFSLCSLCVKEGLIAAGGFGGELVVKRLHGSTEVEAPCDAALRVTTSDNGITNAIDIFRSGSSTSGRLQIVLSNNDEAVRIYDAASFTCTSTFKMPWAVNCAAADPFGRLLCVVGDDKENVLLDATNGTVVGRLRGHVDYSFACAWHPDGNIVATGNQDLTTRIYDLRYTKKPLALLMSRIGAVRSLKFSPDGRYMAAAEPADYVTVYDVASSYTQAEQIDLFGEIAGVCFDPDETTRMFIGVADVHYGSLLQYKKRDRLDLNVF